MLRITSSRRAFFIISAIVFMSGCTTNTSQYYWGNYEQILYDMYVSTDGSDPQTQVDLLSDDIQKAVNNGKFVPPGVYAHLGMMQASVGNIDDAIAAFDSEKTLYPESSTLIDGMLSRATAQRNK